MRMGDCMPVHHGFMVAMGGAPTQMSSEVCPEYTLVSDKVVFVIVGKSSDQLIPLADVVDFRFNKNELAMRIDGRPAREQVQYQGDDSPHRLGADSETHNRPDEQSFAGGY